MAATSPLASPLPLASHPLAVAATAMPDAVRALADELAALTTRPWTLMEVCGGQTHAILRWGLDQLLPPGLRLIHGPGCPVCITATASLDAALALARRREVILCSYGDMLRVPGTGGASLQACRAEGGDVRLLTTPLQALEIARLHPRREVVFLAVGFETTAPATALLARRVLALGVTNLSLLTAHGRVAAAMEALLRPESECCAPSPVQGFLAAGHVCSVVGTDDLAPLVARHRVPVVVSGFEPLELMRAILACVRLLEAGTPQLVNAYGHVVRQEGTPAARALLAEVFQVVDQPWRGFGVIPAGGLALRSAYAIALDARQRFGLRQPEHSEGVPSPPRIASNAPAVPSESTTSLGLCDGCLDPSPTTQGPNRVPPDFPLTPPGRSAGFTTAPLTPSPGPPAAGPSPLPEASKPAASLHLAADLAPPLAARSLCPTALRTTTAAGPAPDSGLNEPPRASGDPCLAGAILRGRILPPACPAFGRSCTPEQPLGAPMVSAEGACAAYHRHRPPIAPPTVASATGSPITLSPPTVPPQAVPSPAVPPQVIPPQPVPPSAVPPTPMSPRVVSPRAISSAAIPSQPIPPAAIPLRPGTPAPVLPPAVLPVSVLPPPGMRPSTMRTAPP